MKKHPTWNLAGTPASGAALAMFAVLASGCMVPGLGGDETDGYTDELDGSTGETVEVTAFQSAIEEDADLGMELTAETEAIAVEHALRAPCAAIFTGATVDSEGSILTVDCEVDPGSTDEGTCTWLLNYRLVGVSAGRWTVSSEGDSAEVTVPNAR